MKLEQLLDEETMAKVKQAIDKANEGKEKTEQIRFVDLSEGEYVSKEKYNSLDAEHVELKKKFKQQESTIKDLSESNKDNADLQGKIEKLQADLKQSDANLVNTRREFAVKTALSKNGVLDPDYVLYKAGGVEGFEFDDSGKPKNLDDVLKPFKEDKAMAHLFKAEPYSPTAGGGTPKINPFDRKTFNLTEQSKLFKENPEQARQLAHEAGVKL